jgi:hypothetical protein
MTRSDRRGNTGKGWIFLIFLGLGLAAIWLAPLWVNRLFPDFLIWSVEPWHLNEADLDVRRVLSNWVAKPGLRTLAAAAFATIVLGGKWLIFDQLRGSGRDWWQKAASRKNLASTEFVVEGRRSSLLVEFARGIEAV